MTSSSCPGRSRGRWLGAGRVHEGAQARAVGVRDPGRPEVLAGGRISSPVARTAIRGRSWTSTSPRPAPARRATAAGPDRRARREERRARFEVAAGVRTEPPRSIGSCTRIATGNGPVASRPRGPGGPFGVEWRRLLDRDDRVRPVGSACAGAIRTADPGWTATSGATPARISPFTARRIGVVLRGARPCPRRRSRSRPSRSCPRAAARPRDRRLGQHPAERVVDHGPGPSGAVRSPREPRRGPPRRCASPRPRLFRGRHAALNPAWPAR